MSGGAMSIISAPPFVAMMQPMPAWPKLKAALTEFFAAP
jgi:hypothetical protein